jgi:hypothetical protein
VIVVSTVLEAQKRRCGCDHQRRGVERELRAPERAEPSGQRHRQRQRRDMTFEHTARLFARDRLPRRTRRRDQLPHATKQTRMGLNCVHDRHPIR